MEPPARRNEPASLLPFPAGTPTQTPVEDIRFRRLLGEEAWRALPHAVRRRFSKHFAETAVEVFVGKIVGARATRTGRLLAQITRLIGAPLPLDAAVGTPATVTVCEEKTTKGQLWTRVYGRSDGFPQVIRSAKRFQGPTGLEEYLGYGIGMALTVDAADNMMRFRSDHFFMCLFGRRVRIPGALLPIAVTVRHIDQGNGGFIFDLEVRGDRLGLLIYQAGLFRDVFDTPGTP